MESNQVVIKPSIARKLLKDGYSICDIKPQMNEKTGTYDFTRCVFIFSGKDGLYRSIEKYKSKL